MKCPNCKTRIPNDAVFCPICDFKVSKDKDVRHGLDETLHEDYSPSFSGYEGVESKSHHAETDAERYSCRHDESEKVNFRARTYNSNSSGTVRSSVTGHTYPKANINGIEDLKSKCVSQLVIGIVMTCIFGFFGLIALIPAIIALSYANKGDNEQALKALNSTKKLTKAVVVLMILAIVFGLAAGIVGILSGGF